jgi:hypothetical protein
LDTTTVFPLLLEVFKANRLPQNAPEIEQVCTDLESFFVRRVVCGLTPKNYNRLFSEIVGKLRESKDFSAAAIRKFLLLQTAEISRWPTDDEFKRSWTALAFYKRIKRDVARMILEGIDAGFFTDKTEQLQIKAKLTIEHLMPQEWEKHWPLPVTDSHEEAVRRRNERLHTVGNLTLLTKKLNPAVSNGAWKEKRVEILKHSAVNMNRQFQNVESWDECQITERTVAMFDVARKIWPYPSEEK